MKSLAWVVISVVMIIATNACHSTKRTELTNPTPTVTPMAEPLKGQLASYKFQVDARAGKCVFTYDGPFKGELITDLSPPCNFSREPDGSVQHIVQKNSGKGGGDYTVMLLLGGPIDPSRSDKYMPNGCATETEPVSLSPRGVELRGTGGGIPICPLDALDRPWF
jgi:hypothetical protein